MYYNDIIIALQLVPILLILVMAFIIWRTKKKQQIHYVFFSTIILLFIWSSCRLIQTFIENSHKYIVILEHISYIGVCLIPVSLLYIGIIFARTRINFSWKHVLLFIIPAISILLVFTNGYHHLFIVKYSFISSGFIYGKYYIIHEVYSYLCIAVGLYYLLSFSIKNAGFFSKQSGLIFLGTLIPLIVVVLSTEKVVDMPVFVENISFSFGMICFMFAILKFDFLNIVPVALQNVVDQISDSYVIINEELEVIDYNKTFVYMFSEVFTVKRKEILSSILESEGKPNNIDTKRLTAYIKEAIKEKKPVALEKQIIAGEFDKYFTIEITPIIKNSNHIGTIILLKDITQHKKDLEKIEQTQNQLLERERLAFLGELAGGVAHDINSPLSVIMGGMTFIERLFIKYRDSYKNENMTPEKRKEIEDEILHQISNSSNASQKIVKIVNSIRNHTRNLSGDNIQDFYVSNVFEDIKTLLNHQIKSTGCELEVSSEDNTMIKGDPGKLGQVITNLVVNALQAYGINRGKIELKSRKEKNNIVIAVEDNAGGIPEMYKKGIFFKMLTTKGVQGTGLGLYLSYSIVTGHFNGKMWFETEEGKGTKFYISIPVTKAQTENLNVG